MLIHEFVIASHEEIIHKIEYSITKTRKVIQVPDCLIMNNPSFLESFESQWDCINYTQKGLNYYGITILLREQLPKFLEVLNCYKQYPYVCDLIELCNNAFSQKKCVVHFGI